jgi:hypothetical protein
LVRQAKIADLLGVAPEERLEASGVVTVGEVLYVIFDNLRQVARLTAELSPDGDNSTWRPRGARRSDGREDIAHDPASGRFYILSEALPRDDAFMAKVEVYDECFDLHSTEWLDFSFEDQNKGMEGLTCVNRGGETYLLGLCEGNLCKGGRAGKRGGGGRIQVFQRGRRRWKRVDTIELPEQLRFVDYSSAALAGDRLCVTSQSSAALWVGGLASSEWRVHDLGAVHTFPRDPEGRTLYCNVEGVAWLSADEVVVVSDKANLKKQKRRCEANDQSVHVFKLPNPPIGNSD